MPGDGYGMMPEVTVIHGRLWTTCPLLRIRRSLTAAVTATAAHNQPIGLTATTDDREVEACDLGLSLN